jgi:hypothetical protein
MAGVMDPAASTLPRPSTRVSTTSPTTSIPSLKSLCVATILSHPSPLSSDLTALASLAASLDLGADEVGAIRRKLKNALPLLLERFTEDSLSACLGDAFMVDVKSWLEDRTAAEAFRRNTCAGFVIEAGVTEWSDKSIDDFPDGVPLAGLVKGVVYPRGVDVRNREMHLADEDFERVLGMTKRQWEGVCRAKKIEIKKTVNLF